MSEFAKPKIPSGLLHDMKTIEVTVSRDVENGGQWKPSLPKESQFRGVVMPLANEDLQYMPEGSYTRYTQKLYTNGEKLEVGAQFVDCYDNVTYTVVQELSHGGIHPMKRYAVEKKGVAVAR